jgi:hypothetical protein
VVALLPLVYSIYFYKMFRMFNYGSVHLGSVIRDPGGLRTGMEYLAEVTPRPAPLFTSGVVEGWLLLALVVLSTIWTLVCLYRRARNAAGRIAWGSVLPFQVLAVGVSVVFVLVIHNGFCL